MLNVVSHLPSWGHTSGVKRLSAAKRLVLAECATSRPYLAASRTVSGTFNIHRILVLFLSSIILTSPFFFSQWVQRTHFRKEEDICFYRGLRKKRYGYEFSCSSSLISHILLLWLIPAYALSPPTPACITSYIYIHVTLAAQMHTLLEQNKTLQYPMLF